MNDPSTPAPAAIRTTEPGIVRFRSDGLELVGERVVAAEPRGTVVLLHGGGQTRHSWRGTARRLAEAGWSAVSYDARGHGDSEWARSGGYSMDALVADLGAVVHTIDEPPVLIGASMGGLTSLVAVGEGHLDVRGVVLVDVAPRVEPAGLTRITGFMSASPQGFATLEDAADAIAAYTPGRKRPPGLDGLRKNLRLRQDGRWHWHWDPSFLNFGDEPTRSARHRRLIESAAGVRAPTLIVRGTRSDVVSAAGAAELLSTTPGAREVTVPGAGHMLVGDDNDVFSREVIAFLEDLPER